MLNPRQVEAFRAVMTTGSVTSAAITMHVTQPAVSRLIRDLEVTLKLALFERRGNRSGEGQRKKRTAAGAIFDADDGAVHLGDGALAVDCRKQPFPRRTWCELD